jgi:hypothetical protein
MSFASLTYGKYISKKMLIYKEWDEGPMEY